MSGWVPAPRWVSLYVSVAPWTQWGQICYLVDCGVQSLPLTFKVMGTQVSRNEAVDTWAMLLTAFSQIRDALAADLERQTSLGMDRYEILLMLAKAENSELQPSELAAKRKLSRSGATRLVDRLEKDGLVARHSCADDRRVSFVRLTDAGFEQFTAAARVHLRGIELHFGHRLNPADAAELRRILTRFVDG